MLRAATGYVRERIRQRGELIPLGFNWAFVVTVDVAITGIVLIATLQRPTADLPAALIAIVAAVAPFVSFMVHGIKVTFKAPVLWASGTVSAAIFLFATSTPVTADFAPLLLVLTAGVVGSLTNILGGLLATASAAAVLLTASALHRVDAVALYLSFLGMGWLVGYLMRTQQQLMIKQQEAQAQLAEHAAADERRRIAREVHDVIAHSLSVTLLHTTAARRGLQEDRDVDDAVEALEQAEQLGRQAMADIRRTVGLLDDGPMKRSPEPGIDEITILVEDFVRAGLDVTLHVDGPVSRVPGAVGLALYRITQESLANIAKHAPDAQSVVTLVISHTSAMLTITNQLPVSVGATAASEGRGLRGMRQRVELLGGHIDIGPSGDGWAVKADIPLGAADGLRSGWFCGS
ncbi:sensor histidine kinase [Mycobacterium sp.]|uniref:sensor histidine kinase n=1 Tax=Mycobacterium sp. TaxID=1785 RepID=UPI002DA0DC6F|nr:histidine kinase [Mycobacterium sp.]